MLKDMSPFRKMMKDSDWEVRREVVKLIDPNWLHEMMGDPDWRVRIEVAERIPPLSATRNDGGF